jgi:chromosome segregation ATPase
MTSLNTTLSQQIQESQSRTKDAMSALGIRLDEFNDRVANQLGDFESSLHAWECFQSELVSREEELAERETELNQRCADLDQQIEEQTAACRARVAERLKRRRQQLKTTAEQVAVTQTTESQDSAALQAELDAAHARVQASEQQLADVRARNEDDRAELDSCQDQLAELRVEETSLREHLAESRQSLKQRASQLKAARKRIAELTQGERSENGSHAEEVALICRERDELKATLDQLKAKVANDKATDNEGALRDLRRRFELAVESVRALKNRNEDVTKQLNELREAAAHAGSAQQGVEQEVLDQFNSLGPKGALSSAVTDRLLARKDEKIKSLQNTVASLQQNIHALRQPAKSNGEANPQDAQEVDLTNTEHPVELGSVQQEWIEKQRASEVQLAVERAQNSRLRTELQEKMRDVEAELALARKKASAIDISPQRASSGWLARLRHRDEE